MKLNNYSKGVSSQLSRLSLFLFLQVYVNCSYGVTIAGVSEGSGSVNAIGAFTYEIPIKIAPGINDLSPQISLNYNSHSPAKGSPLGYGWSVFGLSEIHRCGKIIAIDSIRDGVKYNDDSDRLCKDGTPLVASSVEYWNADFFCNPIS